VLHAARWKCRTQKIAKNSTSGHHRTTLSGYLYIFATKARIDDQKKLLNSNISPRMSLQYGELWPTSGCTPANFNGSRLGSVTARHHCSNGRQQLCGVVQRAPPIFGRAAITLGIGQHSTPWVKKGCHPNHGYNFVNSWSICKILSLLQRAVNFQQNQYNVITTP